MSEKLLRFIADIMTAVSNCSLYSKNHPSVRHLSENAVKTLEELYSDDTVDLTILGDSIIFNNVPFTGKTVHMLNFMKKLRRKGIEKIVFAKGVTTDELMSLISELTLSDKVSAAYEHISTGAVQVKLKAEGTGVETIVEENRSKVKEVYHGLSRFKSIDMVGLEDVVISFISTLRKEANVLNLVSPVKSYSEYTYAHTTNVAVLSMFQAEALGLKGEILHDIGLAGLLHDVGKMLIPREIIDKQAKLTKAEWLEIERHPVNGAILLSSLPDVPDVAVIATYEHHMKFNGSGYPDTKRRGKKQHLISQIISIADFFDALRTERSYRKALSVPIIMGLIKESAGRDFNPLLVENFFNAFRKIRAFGP